MEIIINKKFINSFNDCNTDETYRIIAINLIDNTIIYQVSKNMNNEVWNTQRELNYTKEKVKFSNNHYKYI